MSHTLNTTKLEEGSHRICVAPMLDWTDRHCRFFHRLLTHKARLYTEMVTSGALLHGDIARHLACNPQEHPLALQLGGSDPKDLAHCARLAREWQYDEINLNCGCPSERVQRGSFGACLMDEPKLVAQCVQAMREASDLPITVKHRIGIAQRDTLLDKTVAQQAQPSESDYGFLRDFIGTVAEAGCDTFIVHARKAVLKGLNPKQNREIPPLKYEYAYRVKRDFPHLTIILNGGVTTLEEAKTHLCHVDGVMLGRQAYHTPWILSQVDSWFYPERLDAHPHADLANTIPSVNQNNSVPNTRAEIVEQLKAYADQELQRGTYLGAITRHVLGLYHGCSGARHWRRTLSEHTGLAQADVSLFDVALANMQDDLLL